MDSGWCLSEMTKNIEVSVDLIVKLFCVSREEALRLMLTTPALELKAELLGALNASELEALDRKRRTGTQRRGGGKVCAVLIGAFWLAVTSFSVLGQSTNSNGIVGAAMASNVTHEVEIAAMMTNVRNVVKLNRIAKARFAEGIRIEGKIKSIDDVTHSITVQTTTKPSLEVFAYIGRPYRNGMEELKIGEMLVLEGEISAVNSFGENTLVLMNARPVINR